MAPLVVLGDHLGLYKALAADEPSTSDELANRTATTERYIREWCLRQVGFGYISYDKASGPFSMSPEQQVVFADTDSPTCLTGGYYAIAAMCIDEPKFTHIFKSGEGLS